MVGAQLDADDKSQPLPGNCTNGGNRQVCSCKCRWKTDLCMCSLWEEGWEWWISILCQRRLTSRDCSFDKLDLKRCQANSSQPQEGEQQQENYQELDNKDSQFRDTCSCGSFAACCTLSGVVGRPPARIEVRRLQLQPGFSYSPSPHFHSQLNLQQHIIIFFQTTPPGFWNGVDWRTLAELHPPNIGKLRR